MEEITSVKFQKMDERHIGYSLRTWVAKEGQIKNSEITYSTDTLSECAYMVGFSGKVSDKWETTFFDFSEKLEFKNTDLT